MSTRSFSVGSYTRHIDTPESEFDQRVRAFKDDNMPDGPENAPAEEVRAWGEMFQRADQKLNTIKQNADVFIAAHPEFLDTTPNAERMNATLKALFGDVAHSIEQYETAYRVLLANNSVALDGKVLAAQDKAARDQRAAAARDQRSRETRVYSEEEKESMSLDELRQVENREIQNRMRRIAEEGGW